MGPSSFRLLALSVVGACAVLVGGFLTPAPPSAALGGARPAARERAGVLDMRWANRAHKEAVDRMLTLRAVEGVTYYLEEFRDVVTREWLGNFLDFRKQGLGRRNWRSYIRAMIQAPPQNVTLTRPSPFARSGSGKNPYIRATTSFDVTIDPSNVAKRVLQVRKHLSTEWSSDLRCIARENDEVRRFARNTRKFSEEEAKRMRSAIVDFDPLSSSSTPYRGNNYNDLTRIITDIAIDQVRADLFEAGESADLKWLEWYLDQTEGMNTFDRLQRMYAASRRGSVLVPAEPRTPRERKELGGEADYDFDDGYRDEEEQEKDAAAEPRPEGTPAPVAGVDLGMLYHAGQVEEKEVPVPEEVDSKELARSIMDERAHIADFWAECAGKAAEDQQELLDEVPKRPPSWDLKYATKGVYQSEAEKAEEERRKANQAMLATGSARPTEEDMQAAGSATPDEPAVAKGEEAKAASVQDVQDIEEQREQFNQRKREKLAKSMARVGKAEEMTDEEEPLVLINSLFPDEAESPFFGGPVVLL